MAQNMNQWNIALLPYWRAAGNQGDLPVGVSSVGGVSVGPNGQLSEGGAGGAGGDIASTVAGQFKLSDADKKALDALKISGIDYNTIEQQALKDFEPYYTRLLQESNYDVNLAKQRLEEDYQKGLRTGREDATTALRTLVGDTFPQETRDKLDELNRRGLLGTQTANANQPQTTTLPDGTQMTQAPITTTGFGGAGGQELDRLRTSQNTRQEAITRALKRNEEQSALSKTRQTEDINLQQQRGDFQREQEKREKATQLAGERYARQVQTTEAKRNEILNPYLNQA